MNFITGDTVWVRCTKRSKGDGPNTRRMGKIAGIYDKFVCVFIYSKDTMDRGWHECFLYVDLSMGEYEISTVKTSDSTRKVAAV